jgi:hypothetical protein
MQRCGEGTLTILLICTKRKVQQNLISFCTAPLSFCLTCAGERNGCTFYAGGVRGRRSGQAVNTVSIGFLPVTRKYDTDLSIFNLVEFIRVHAAFDI